MQILSIGAPYKTDAQISCVFKIIVCYNHLSVLPEQYTEFSQFDTNRDTFYQYIRVERTSKSQQHRLHRKASIADLEVLSFTQENACSTAFSA